ncbi:MAG TPA: ATP-binding protein [Planococcus sp. (in: firmicutes)]|nr:ATP-binding protein [Planococcus sp. (in: firmicutes)]
MLFKPLRKWKKTQPPDLFSKARNRLVLFYTAIMAVFLLAFVFFALTILIRTLTDDHEGFLLSVSDREYELYQRILVSEEDASAERRVERRIAREGLAFVYLKNDKGEMIFSTENFEEMAPIYARLIDEWYPVENEFRQTRGAQLLSERAQATFWEDERRLMMLASPIFLEDQIIGTLYTSFDISYFNPIFRSTFTVFISLALIFIGIGFLLSLWMSKRALLPVRQAYDLQREFVSDASHELRTPLSVIQSTAEALDMEDERKDPFTEKMLATLKFEVKRMSGLINELLTLTEHDSATSAAGVGTDPFDIRADSERILDSFSARAKEKGIALQLQAPPTLMVWGNREKLMQLLYILVDNALKYTPEGGQVAVDLQPDSKKGREQLQLTVTDSGIGISPENQERVFDRFFRVDKARSRDEGGYGLGLPIAKSIVEAHQGEIHLDSEPGRGTSIMVKIPSGSK